MAHDEFKFGTVNYGGGVVLTLTLTKQIETIRRSNCQNAGIERQMRSRTWGSSGKSRLGAVTPIVFAIELEKAI
ncbi:hypothetical protein [Chamaesiphon polymorphus]|nr:hypothetical protein [Chamaesiphon polymorphus]